jgi:hypothetical protein
MKKIIMISLAILLCGSMAFAATPPGKGDIMGQANFPSDPGKIFRLVRFVPASGSINSTTLSAESIVIWDTTSADGVTVTTTTTSSDARIAGIVVNDILTPENGALGNTAVQDLGKRNWGYIQTYGYAKAMFNSLGASVVGTSFGTSATASQSGSDSTAGTIAGVSLETTTSGETKVFLRVD